VSEHEAFLELAAAAVDFGLTPTEQAALDGHLSTCVPCRRRVVGLRHDAQAVRHLAPYVLAPERAQRIWRRIDEPRRTSLAALRLVAVAALLALLAVSALSVGAVLLQRDDDLREAVVATPVASPAPSDTEPSPARPTEGFAADTIVEIVVTDLRVRTEPTVDDARSARIEPLLGLGTRLRIMEGPVIADDYEWYRVEAVGWPHRGWVAAADHDGEPWIEDPSLRGPTVALSVTEQYLVDELRSEVRETCGPRTAGLPTGAIAGVECRVSTALVARVGAYRFDSPQAAASAYLGRLATAGVTFGSGDCTAGKSGDDAWADGASGLVQFADSEWQTQRVGCFLDEYGTANVRVTCGSTYVGVLGRTDDLAALHEWAWLNPVMNVLEPSPGICANRPQG
jgi:hypothetical protein